MTDEQIIELVNHQMDRKIDMAIKRRLKIAELVKQDKKKFIAHMQKVLSRYTKESYLKYRQQIELIADSLPGDEGWMEHKDRLKRSTNGVYVFLRTSLDVRDYYTIADLAGVPEEVMDKIVWKRAAEIYPRRQKKKSQEAKGYSYTPPKLHNIPNDKIAHNLKSATPEEWAYGQLDIIEGEDKKGEKITSTVQLKLDKLRALGYNDLDQFDWFVCMTCLAIQSAGNEAVTINALYRAMTGKKGDAAPSAEMRKAIIDSVAKGIACVVASDARGICEFWKKPIKGARSIGSILPARIDLEGTVNSVQVKDLVVFIDESPLVKIAEAKGGQFMTYDAELLNVPVNTNKQNILIAPYLLQHIEDTAFAKHLKKVIVIDNAIAELGYTGKRKTFANHVVKCFEHWEKVGYIKGFTVEKDRLKITRISFTLPPRDKRLKK